MVREKVLGLSTDAQVDNVILFSSRDNKRTIQIKDNFNLKQCGITKSCIMSDRDNPYNCECFKKCSALKEILELFL